MNISKLTLETKKIITNIEIFKFTKQESKIVEYLVNFNYQSGENIIYSDEIIEFKYTCRDISNYSFNQNNTLEECLIIASKIMNISIPELKSKSKRGLYVKARYLYYVIARTTTKKSLYDIGDLVGRKHDTVIHALKTFLSYHKTFNETISVLSSIVDKEKIINLRKQYDDKPFVL